ncbi:hypothetical protein DPMN_187849 [Dreissena polymorpha]|uniref:Uncharacterized protein n=1 Tax=Dreissena polymorpha TaxID=45954 RepID=A0A9D4DRU8_DREPO|nr:hypothetical protein DPMN_187849 [Dreissena polymorpha]
MHFTANHLDRGGPPRSREINFPITVRLTPQLATAKSPISTVNRVAHLRKQDIIWTNLLTKFHKDRKINVASRKNAPPSGSHVFQPTGIICELVQDIFGMHLLTKFHEDRKVNVASRVHYFQAKIFIFKLIQDIILTNLLTKFHEDWTINVSCPWWPYIIGTNLLTKFHDDQKINLTSRVLTRKIAPPPWWPYIIGMNLLTKKNAPPLGGHVFQANVAVFELIQDIIKTNLLTVFHQDWTINLASRVLRKNAPSPGGHIFQPTSIIFKLEINVASRPYNENAPPLGSHVFQAKVTIFELIQDISGTNLLSKFHTDRKINVASRVLTMKNAPPPSGHVFQSNDIIFELVQDIIGINLLDKFHEDRTINLASRVKNAPLLGSNVFQAKVTIFELIQYISRENLLSKFHEDRIINVASRVLTMKTAPLPGGHVFNKPTGINFKLFQYIFGINFLTKIHEDRTINVASRVLRRKTAPLPGGHVFNKPVSFSNSYRTINVASRLLTRFYYSHIYSHIRKNTPPLGRHVFQAKVTIFELIQDISGTNLLSKFHEDQKINVTSRVLARKIAPPPWWPSFSTNRHNFCTHRTINVASRVKNAPPLGSNVFQAKVTIFELIPYISGTNLLSKLHEDWTINVAS